MPKKTKDKIIEDIKNVSTTNLETAIKKTATKKVSTKAKEKSKLEVTTKKFTTKKSTATNKSATVTKKKTSTTKSKSTKENASTKKKTTKSASRTTSPTTRSRKKKVAIPEYYDLPNTYEQTVVKILAQTPTILFVYWDIANSDKQNLLNQYGEYFFQDTTPFLLVINKTKNYQFEVEINDYANSWYLTIPDSDCEYEVILMRKNKNLEVIHENNGSITIASSNNLETPNDHILFDKLGKTVFFQNVKNHNLEEKNISSFHFIHNIGKIYNIYDLYKEIYKNELNVDELGTTLSSSNFSSTFK